MSMERLTKRYIGSGGGGGGGELGCAMAWGSFSSTQKDQSARDDI